MDISRSSVKSASSKIEDFCREIYTAESKDKPLSAIVQVQSFRHLAGLKTAQIQDKWLGHIPVNSILNAFSQGVSQVYHKFESSSLDKTLLVCNLIMESDNCDNKLLDKLVLTVIGMTDFRVSKLCSKIIKKQVHGNVKLPVSTVVAIFTKEEILLDKCLEELQEKTGKELQNSWLIKESMSNDDLYQKLSKTIEGKYPSFLPVFIQNTSLSSSTVKFYPPFEQPCIILSLLPRDMDSKMKDIHVPKMMYELLQLWLKNPPSVHKLLTHFPQLTEWLMEYCDRDVNAQRLCLHFINNAV